MRTALLLLAVACAAVVGIECAKGNLNLFEPVKNHVLAYKRIEGRNCPLYYSQELR
ncbi:MAG: hypothetical protein AB7D57_02990 [Desulfovibrionaceae bacterium]